MIISHHNYDDEKNKYSVIDGTTTFHTEDKWAYSDRKHSRDNLVWKKGEMDIISPLLGVIRGEKLFARRPYVFLAHKSNKVEAETKSGIKYEYSEAIAEREVLSVSEESNKKYGIRPEQKIIADEFDIFEVKLRDSKIQAILDQDILAGF